MKYLFIETFPASPHFETSLEIAYDLKQKGHDITFFWCGYDLPWTDWELPIYKKFMLFSYDDKIKQSKNFLKKHSINVLNKLELDRSFYNSINFEKKKIKNFSSLKKIKYKNKISLGISVFSSLKSKYHDKNFDKIKKYAMEAFHSSCLVYERSCLAIKEVKPDAIITFNNRFAISKPIIEAAKNHNIKIISHERGSSLDKYQVFEGNMFNWDLYKKKINTHWRKEKNLNKKINVVKKYFIQLEKKIFFKKIGFNYEKKLINKIKINKNKKVILFLCSTDYEHQAITNNLKDFYINKLWSDQFNVIKSISDIIKSKKNHILYIKSHPNFSRSPILEKKISKLTGKNIFYLSSNKNIDSLHLIRNSQLVMSFGSSLELYSSFKEKKTLSFFKSWWSKFDLVIYPKNKSHLIKLINQNNKKFSNKKRKENLLKVCYYMVTFGKKFKLFKPSGHSRGLFVSKSFNHYGPLLNSLLKFDFFSKLITKI